MEAIISVVVPCFNQEQFLEEALSSVQNQTYKQWECVIVDDGSTDGSASIAAEFIKKDSRFSYFRKINGGPSSAKNLGISKSTGKYVFPFDGDDILDLNYFENAVRILECNSQVEVVHCNVMQFGNITGPLVLEEYSFEKLLIKNCIIGCAFFRRATYNLTNGFCEDMWALEDWDIWLSILKQGGEVYKFNDFYYNYRRHAQGSLVNKFSSDAALYQKNLNRLYKNHADVFMQHHGNPITLYRQLMALTQFRDKMLGNPFYKLFKSVASVIKK